MRKQRLKYIIVSVCSVLVLGLSIFSLTASAASMLSGQFELYPLFNSVEVSNNEIDYFNSVSNGNKYISLFNNVGIISGSGRFNFYGSSLAPNPPDYEIKSVLLTFECVAQWTIVPQDLISSSILTVEFGAYYNGSIRSRSVSISINQDPYELKPPILMTLEIPIAEWQSMGYGQGGYYVEFNIPDYAKQSILWNPIVRYSYSVDSSSSVVYPTLPPSENKPVPTPIPIPTGSVDILNTPVPTMPPIADNFLEKVGKGAYVINSVFNHFYSGQILYGEFGDSWTNSFSNVIMFALQVGAIGTILGFVITSVGVGRSYERSEERKRINAERSQHLKVQQDYYRTAKKYYESRLGGKK